jgi:hypothetical protein
MNKTEQKRLRQEANRRKQLERQLANEHWNWKFKYPPARLLFQGPIINTSIHVSASHEEALKAAGHPVPDPVVCRFLIDTGASGCVVKHEIAERADLKLVNTSSPLRGIGQDDSGRTYYGRIVFARESTLAPGTIQTAWVECQIASANLQDATDFDGLIGRDVLAYFDLRYNGPTGELMLTYVGPRTDKPR